MNLIAAFISLGGFCFLVGLGVASLTDKYYKLALSEFALACVNIPFFILNLFIVLGKLK